MARPPKKVSFSELKENFNQQENPDFIFPRANIEFPVGQQFFHNGIDLRQRTIIFDTETTGLDTGKVYIIEIAGEVVEWENGIPTLPSVLIRHEMDEIEDTSSERYKELEAELKKYEFHDYLSLPENMEIPPETFKVHGITDAFLKEHGRDPATVIEEFRAFVGDSLMVAHNASYDRDVLETNRLRYRLDAFRNPVIDSLMMAKQRFAGISGWSLDFLSKKVNVSLYERQHRHSADVDSRILAQLYRIMILGVGKKLDDFTINTANLDFQQVEDDEKIFSAKITADERKLHNAYLEKYGFPKTP